ncbi:MAG: hypothetical protein HYY52_07430 [Candidatus Melainabacteria bacterium]|nr:hypothetical protein [Candidatus Melainabacteria bacterium]
MSRIATIILAQNKNLPGSKKLHWSFFSRELNKKALDIEVYERTDPVRYMKYGNNLYGEKKPTYSVVNTAGIKFEFTRNFGDSQLRSAEKLFLREARVWHPRVIFFEAPALDTPDTEEQIILNKLATHYKLFVEAGIATVSTCEENVLREILKLLELIRNT